MQLRRQQPKIKRAVSDHPRTVAGMALVAGVGAGTAAFMRDRRRRHMTADRAEAAARATANRLGAGVRQIGGAAMEASSPVRHAGREYDDVTLVHKVESEIVYPPGVPKGAISVNAQDGVVELRGQVKRPEDIRALGDAAGRVSGVRDVHNLLHTAGSPPKHSPPSSPEDVRRRAQG